MSKYYFSYARYNGFGSMVVTIKDGKPITESILDEVKEGIKRIIKEDHVILSWQRLEDEDGGEEPM